MRRRVAFVAAVAVLLTSCGRDPVDTAPETSASLTTSTMAVPITDSTVPAVAAGVTSTLVAPGAGVIGLPRIAAVAGEAPVRLSAAAPVVYLSYGAGVDQIEGPSPPASLTLDLLGCSVGGPGVVVYEVSLGGEGVTYPFETVVLAGISAGDMGTGTVGSAVFAAAGRQLIVSSLSDQFRPYEAVGETNFRQDDSGSYANRELNWAWPGMSCELELGPDYEVRSGSLDLRSDPLSLEITAPGGTVEALAQEAYGDAGDAALLPLAIAYGEAFRFYSERWFIPADPERLEAIEERLSDDGCLENEFTYESYTVIQQLRCPLAESDAVFQAGDRWFATATDGAWVVKVAARDRESAVGVASSLRPYWHLFHRDVPLATVSEEEIGRAPYQDGEVLITFGEQRCSDSCLSPETWFYVYRIIDGTLDEYAHYPGWSGCVLVEENEFVLAVAPRRGTIDVTGPDGTEKVTSNKARPFVFLEKKTDALTVEMVDEDGNVPYCVEQRRGDTRGGIEPFPGSDSVVPEPSAERVIVAEPCSTGAVSLSDFTDEEPLRQACVDTEFGRLTIAHVVPNDMMAEPPDGLECLVEMHGTGASAGCSTAGADKFEIGVSGYEGFSSFSAFVPEGTTRIVGVTSLGTSLVGIPHDRLVLLWWLNSEGELREVVAETDDGPITLRQER